jgi:protoporphyrinogen oxidase
METIKKIVVVGGGIAGLTLTSYLAKFGREVLLLEKEDKASGYFNSFSKDGYFFDAGIRAVENSVKFILTLCFFC